MKKNYIYFLFFIFLSLANCNIFAGEPIILRYADKLIGENNDNVNSRTLVGNVQLQQGNVYVNCVNATQYILLNKYKLSNNVVIKQNTLTLKSQYILYDGNSYIATAEQGVIINDKTVELKADRGEYSTKTFIANFYDNVVFQDDSVSIFCNYINHNRVTSDSKAIGNVLIKGKHTNVFLFGDTVVNIANTNYSLATGNPLFYRIDTITVIDTIDNIVQEHNKFDTLTITADTMEAFRSNTDEYYHFIGNVKIIKDNISAISNDIYFYKHKQYFILKDNPVIWYDNAQMHSDSIVIFFDKNKITNIQAINNAFVIMQNDTNNLNRKDQLAGNQINITFLDDSLRIIKSNGNARSIYFMLNNKEADGVVESSADSIQINISQNGTENITLINQNQGNYQPEKFVTGMETDFILNGYKFSDKKPIKREFDIQKYIKN